MADSAAQEAAAAGAGNAEKRTLLNATLHVREDSQDQLDELFSVVENPSRYNTSIIVITESIDKQNKSMIIDKDKVKNYLLTAKFNK